MVKAKGARTGKMSKTIEKNVANLSMKESASVTKALSGSCKFGSGVRERFFPMLIIVAVVYCLMFVLSRRGS